MTAATLPSRVPAPRKVLKSLRSLLVRVDRVTRARALTTEELQWCHRTFDAVQRIVEEGDAVLPAHVDPRDQRKVRKRNITKK